MHLTLFAQPSGHHVAAWRHPRSQADVGVNIDGYTAIARTAEAACFDAMFLGDNHLVRRGPPGAVSRLAQYVAHFEPLTLISALSARTERIGFIATASTSFNEPFHIARKFASIDHLSHGRAGWNVVTSGLPGESNNFGREELDEHELRYERATEFVQVCKDLWDSWEDDAFPRDKQSGRFSLPDKMHVVGHEGTHFQVRGPLNVPRPPQGHPVLVQAGASPTGMRFAAEIADMVFATPQTLEEGVATYRRIKDAVADAGRNPDHVKVMPGLGALVGSTREAADEDWDLLQSLIHIDVAINTLEFKFAGMVDLSKYDLDEPLPASANPGLAGGYFERWHEIGVREGLTLRQLAYRTASTGGVGVTIRGSASDVVDMMQEWVEAGAADGFNLMPPFLPGALDDFVAYAVPELRRRGRFREAYDGTTLRDHLGLPRPSLRFAQRVLQ